MRLLMEHALSLLDYEDVVVRCQRGKRGRPRRLQAPTLTHARPPPPPSSRLLSFPTDTRAAAAATRSASTSAVLLTLLLSAVCSPSQPLCPNPHLALHRLPFPCV